MLGTPNCPKIPILYFWDSKCSQNHPKCPKFFLVYPIFHTNAPNLALGTPNCPKTHSGDPKFPPKAQNSALGTPSSPKSPPNPPWGSQMPKILPWGHQIAPNPTHCPPSRLVHACHGAYLHLSLSLTPVTCSSTCVLTCSMSCRDATCGHVWRGVSSRDIVACVIGPPYCNMGHFGVPMP